MQNINLLDTFHDLQGNPNIQQVAQQKVQQSIQDAQHVSIQR